MVAFAGAVVIGLRQMTKGLPDLAERQMTAAAGFALVVALIGVAVLSRHAPLWCAFAFALSFAQFVSWGVKGAAQ